MLSSHLLFEVERICNRVAIINGGRLLYQGAIENLVSRERVIKITVEPLEEARRLLSCDRPLSVSRNGSNSLYLRMRDEDIPRVNALLVANKISVMELAPQRATLEEVFLTLTGSGVTPSACRQ
jgi:ABC-2 type transport system ATP-binding protein